jgi:hypothetical protein
MNRGAGGDDGCTEGPDAAGARGKRDKCSPVGGDRVEHKSEGEPIAAGSPSLFRRKLKSSARSAENRAGMSSVAAIELVCEQAGSFLGYRGALLALPSGWEAWNAYRTRALVGSLAVSRGSAESFDWAEADYEGPFFAPGSSPSLLDPAAPVARMECVYIAPGLRGGELWTRYAAILAGLGLPVYATFANPRLGERFRAAHTPAGCTTPVG